MAIARKPQAAAKSAAVDIDALINRGGEPANGNSTKARKPESTKPKYRDLASNVTPVILRIPNETLREVDALNESRPVKTPRHTWLLEAIAEKLAREK